MANPLVGKFFIGVHDGSMRSGVIDAAVDDQRYLLRFDNLVGAVFDWPASMGISSIENMLGSFGSDEEGTPAWDIFETEEQRSTFNTWINQEVEGATGPRVVRFGPKDNNPKDSK